jgi:hypothetical protein
VHRILLVLALAIPLLFAGSAAAPASFGPVPADSAAKPKKCKKGKVKVKVGKRSACRPLKKVFPKPKAGDPRQLVTQSVLRTDWSRLRNRRGKRIPSLPKLIRKLGPRAPALLARAASRGVARVDALEARATGARAAARARAAQASRDCAVNSGGARQQDTFTTRSGGTSASVTSTLGPEGAGMAIELSGNGMSVKVDMDLGLCDPNEVEAPQCPTSVGRLQGEIRYKLRVGIEVRRGDEEVWSQLVDVTRRTKLDGWNEIDAKLEQLDVDDVETSTFRLGGSSRAYPPITIKNKLVRRTQVDMRSGTYDPGRSEIDVTIDTEGLFGPDRSDAEAEAERKGQADADRQFRAVIDKAISGYRSRESGWQSPGACAEMRFSPASNTLTLRGGDSGSFTASAIAKSDGGMSELDARLSEIENAGFSPTRAGGQQAHFNYDHVNGSAPPGSKVRVKVHATSKAGVAEGKWEQNIRPPFEINKIAGNFSGSFTQPVGSRTARVTWNGGATFLRDLPPGFPGAAGGFTLSAGHVTFQYSGGNILGHAACNMRGSASVDLFQAGSGAVGVFPLDEMRPFEQGPHDYNAEAGFGFGPMVTLTMENCVPGAASEEGKQYTIPVGFVPLDTGQSLQRSPDGIHYNGSNTQSGSGITTEWHWTLTGEKVGP